MIKAKKSTAGEEGVVDRRGEGEMLSRNKDRSITHATRTGIKHQLSLDSIVGSHRGAGRH